MRSTRQQLAGSVHLARPIRRFAREGRPLHADTSAELGGCVGRYRAGADGSLRRHECDGRRAVEAVTSGSRCLDFVFAILPPLIVAVVLSGGFAIAGAVTELLRSFVKCNVARLGYAGLQLKAAPIIRSAATALARLGEARGPLLSAQTAYVLPHLRTVLLLFEVRATLLYCCGRCRCPRRMLTYQPSMALLLLLLLLPPASAAVTAQLCLLELSLLLGLLLTLLLTVAVLLLLLQ